MRVVLFTAILLSYASISSSQTDVEEFDHFLMLISTSESDNAFAFKYLSDHWKEEFIAPILDVAYVSRNAKIKKQLFNLLRKQTGEHFRMHPFDWYEWHWSEKIKLPNYYADLKAELYKNIDPHFESYFKKRQHQAEIRLDEILWGGVQQDGIPPLRYPNMIDVKQASYLYNNDVIFGIVIDGEARAYPQRILAWHELFIDTIGKYSIAGVYCTLCGTVIIYDTYHNGIHHDLGTSGFLYRSNKLMYDKATQSLWNTVEGKPVLGPLIRDSIQLNLLPVVTTTWKQWKTQYPKTKVLSSKTGFFRNYGQGEAYRAYFATDDLMFPVPLEDQRLKNKDLVYIVRIDNYENHPLAISVDFLDTNPIYQDRIGDKSFIIITDPSGMSRTYYSEGLKFNYRDNSLFDVNGREWIISEEYLISEDGKKLSRIPTHEIFWFAWYNFYPNTRLVK